MTLTKALFRSAQHIALWRRQIGLTERIKQSRFEWHMAFATRGKKGEIFVFNGRTGVIRRASETDIIRDDWEPFYEHTDTRHMTIVKRRKQAQKDLMKIKKIEIPSFLKSDPDNDQQRGR